MGDQEIIGAANEILKAAFDSKVGDALRGVKIAFVPDFKRYGDLPQVQTYAKMAVCAEAELPDASARLGAGAAKKLRLLISELGVPARVATFLENTPCPRVDSVNRDGDKIELRSYFYVGVG